MRSAAVFVIVPALAIAALLTAAAGKTLGIAFSTGHDPYDYGSARALRSLRALRATGANTVQVSVYGGQKSLRSTRVYGITPVNPVRKHIRRLRRMGFQVMLKPVIEIKGSDKWFDEGYIPFIVGWAKFAQEEGVQLLSVGSEYRGTERLTWQWLKVIKAVRKVYRRGEITYIANHDSYKRVKFFNKLNVISISAYFSLLPGKTGRSPLLEETKKRWALKAAEIDRWRREKIGRGKQVLLAEFGVRPLGKGIVYRQPYLFHKVRAPLDHEAQSNMYEAVLDVFLKSRWCRGIHVWNWEISPTVPAGDKGYTPQGKPALKVLTKYFKKWRSRSRGRK